jgi:hypothetical protein
MGFQFTGFEEKLFLTMEKNESDRPHELSLTTRNSVGSHLDNGQNSSEINEMANVQVRP